MEAGAKERAYRTVVVCTTYPHWEPGTPGDRCKLRPLLWSDSWPSRLESSSSKSGLAHWPRCSAASTLVAGLTWWWWWLCLGVITATRGAPRTCSVSWHWRCHGHLHWCRPAVSARLPLRLSMSSQRHSRRCVFEHVTTTTVHYPHAHMHPPTADPHAHTHICTLTHTHATPRRPGDVRPRASAGCGGVARRRWTPSMRNRAFAVQPNIDASGHGGWKGPQAALDTSIPMYWEQSYARRRADRLPMLATAPLPNNNGPLGRRTPSAHSCTYSSSEPNIETLCAQTLAAWGATLRIGNRRPLWRCQTPVFQGLDGTSSVLTRPPCSCPGRLCRNHSSTATFRLVLTRPAHPGLAQRDWTGRAVQKGQTRRGLALRLERETTNATNLRHGTSVRSSVLA